MTLYKSRNCLILLALSVCNENNCVSFVIRSALKPRGWIVLRSSLDKDDKLISDIPISERGIGVGVDLGTTNSCISILEDGIPKIIPVKNSRTIPSVVSLTSNNKVLKVGKQEEECEGALVYRHVKRIMGTGGTMAARNSKIVPQLSINGSKGKMRGAAVPKLEKQLKEAEENPAMLRSPEDGKDISPVEISSYILRTLFDAAERHVGNNQRVTRAVIGVPAYFNDAQRNATLLACQEAGVKRARLLIEPEAAALAYGIGRDQHMQPDEEEDSGELVLVFDLGGGTYDVSMLHVSAGLIEVVATAGNNMLGGSDFDYAIAHFFSKTIASFTKQHLYNTPASDFMLQAAERVRISLTNNKQVSLALPKAQEAWMNMSYPRSIILPESHSLQQEHNDTHVFCHFTRSQMEHLNNHHFQLLLKPLREVAILAQALLPGDARPSAVQAALSNTDPTDTQLLYEDFYQPSTQSDAQEDIDSETLLQLRKASMDKNIKALRKQQQKARKKARAVSAEEKKFRKEKRNADTAAKTALSSNIKVQDGIHGKPISQVILVGGATKMPAIGRLLTAVTGVVPKKTIHPDEAVALGCAVQAGILDGDNVDLSMHVLTPMQAALLKALAQKKGMKIST